MKPPPSDARWIWVSLPRATFALIVLDGRVVDAAPYGRRYIGWDEHEAAEALRRAGAAFVPLPQQTPDKLVLCLSSGPRSEPLTRSPGLSSAGQTSMRSLSSPGSSWGQGA